MLSNNGVACFGCVHGAFQSVPDAFKARFGRVSNMFSMRLKLVSNAFKGVSNASETSFKLPLKIRETCVSNAF